MSRLAIGARVLAGGLVAVLAMTTASCALLYPGNDPVVELTRVYDDADLDGYLFVEYRVTNRGTGTIPAGSRVEFTAYLYDTAKGKEVALDFWDAQFPLRGLSQGRSLLAHKSVKYYATVPEADLDASRSWVAVRGVVLSP